MLRVIYAISPRGGVTTFLCSAAEDYRLADSLKELRRTGHFPLYAIRCYHKEAYP